MFGPQDRVLVVPRSPSSPPPDGDPSSDTTMPSTTASSAIPRTTAKPALGGGERSRRWRYAVQETSSAPRTRISRLSRTASQMKGPKRRRPSGRPPRRWPELGSTAAATGHADDPATIATAKHEKHHDDPHDADHQTTTSSPTSSCPQPHEPKADAPGRAPPAIPHRRTWPSDQNHRREQQPDRCHRYPAGPARGRIRRGPAGVLRLRPRPGLAAQLRPQRKAATSRPPGKREPKSRGPWGDGAPRTDPSNAASVAENATTCIPGLLRSQGPFTAD